MLRLTLIAILMALSVGLAHAGNKIALVIGNSAYQSSAPIATAQNDMRLIAQSLRPLGFQVTTKANLNRTSLRQAITDFTARLSRLGKDSIGVFYYSGHGVQHNGQNYLVPIGARARSAAEMRRETVPLSFLLSRLNRIKNKLNIVALDASRLRPLGNVYVPDKRGLARTKGAPNSLIALSATPGTYQYSANGSHSLFARALSGALGERNKSVAEMFISVRRTVEERSRGRQNAWVLSYLASDASLAAKPKPYTGFRKPRFGNRFHYRHNSHTYHFTPHYGHARTRSRRRYRVRKPRHRPAPKPEQNQVAGLETEPKPAQTSVLPAFPWPPHKPSVQIRLPREAFAGAETLSAVASQIIAPLRAAGYWEHSFYQVPNGFALVTRLERINEDGSRPSETIRYNVEEDARVFSLAGYIKRLFFASPGYFRLIVFVVAGEPFTASGKTLEQALALDLLHSGANALPPAYEKIKFDNGYGIDALIYEFKKDRQGEAAAQLQPGRIGPHIHLSKAGLSEAFGIKGN